MSISQNVIITVKGQKDQLDCKNKYPIFEDSLAELKGEFRSAGKIKSKIYFGLKCFKEDETGIEKEDINRVDESLLITSINTDNKSIILIRNLKNGIIKQIHTAKRIVKSSDFISMEILIIYQIIYLNIKILIII
mgnify:CR=1 FL=1